MGLDLGSALMMLLRRFGEVISMLVLIVLFALIFDFLRDWVIARAGKR